MTVKLIYHMCRKDEWPAANDTDGYRGSSQDQADGFIHFSTSDQIAESAAKHRAGQDDLVLIAADPEKLGGSLKWEASRDGLLFPHLYGPLPKTAVKWAQPLPLGADGRHIFPALF